MIKLNNEDLFKQFNNNERIYFFCWCNDKSLDLLILSSVFQSSENLVLNLEIFLNKERIYYHKLLQLWKINYINSI